MLFDILFVKKKINYFTTFMLNKEIGRNEEIVIIPIVYSIGMEKDIL